MPEPMTPNEIIDAMLKGDAFSQWLGVEVLAVEAGYCKIRMRVRPEMVNGFGILHGGVSFSFADSAFAFASNSRGRHAVSVDTSISHLAAVQVGDTLIAEAEELDLQHKLAHYQVTVYRNQDDKMALFKGMVYRKREEWSHEVGA
ncbi:MAG: hotdog fold thioesterase [Bacteroidota bacterium]